MCRPNSIVNTKLFHLCGAETCFTLVLRLRVILPSMVQYSERTKAKLGNVFKQDCRRKALLHLSLSFCLRLGGSLKDVSLIA